MEVQTKVTVLLAFIVGLYLPPFRPLFPCVAMASLYVTVWAFLGHFLQDRSGGSETPRLCFTWKGLDCSSFLKDSLPGVQFLAGRFFLYPFGYWPIVFCFQFLMRNQSRSFDQELLCMVSYF